MTGEHGMMGASKSAITEAGELSHCSSFREHCIKALKQARCRITRPRLAVIECLEQTDVPLSPRAIYESVQRQHDETVDQVSVYRILEALNRLGVIHRIFPSGDYLRCHTHEKKESNHIVLNCVICGKASEMHISEDLLKPLFLSIEQEAHFQMQDHILQVNGACSFCRVSK